MTDPTTSEPAMLYPISYLYAEGVKVTVDPFDPKMTIEVDPSDNLLETVVAGLRRLDPGDVALQAQLAAAIDALRSADSKNSVDRVADVFRRSLNLAKRGLEPTVVIADAAELLTNALEDADRDTLEKFRDVLPGVAERLDPSWAGASTVRNFAEVHRDYKSAFRSAEKSLFRGAPKLPKAPFDDQELQDFIKRGGSGRESGLAAKEQLLTSLVTGPLRKPWFSGSIAGIFEARISMSFDGETKSVEVQMSEDAVGSVFAHLFQDGDEVVEWVALTAQGEGRFKGHFTANGVTRVLVCDDIYDSISKRSHHEAIANQWLGTLLQEGGLREKSFMWELVGAHLDMAGDKARSAIVKKYADDPETRPPALAE